MIFRSTFILFLIFILFIQIINGFNPEYIEKYQENQLTPLINNINKQINDQEYDIDSSENIEDENQFIKRNKFTNFHLSPLWLSRRTRTNRFYGKPLWISRTG